MPLRSGEASFSFKQTIEDFVVEEIPNRDFALKGKYLIVKIEKKGLSTWDTVDIFARFLDIDTYQIGYAGLKDKHATTVQYLSFDARVATALGRFRHKRIKILQTFKDTKSIRMGDLRGNRFGINLYDVDGVCAGKIEKTASKIQKEGFANYFGYQRFGVKGDALLQAKEMLQEHRHIRDKRVRNFLTAVYQSDLFNRWLAKRVALSERGKFKLLRGDVYLEMETDRLFTPKEIPLKDFLSKKITPTGLLPGRDVYRAKGEARNIEALFDAPFLAAKGQRRAAVVFVEDFRMRYFPKEHKASLSFSLPKGAYATVLLEALSGRELG